MVFNIPDWLTETFNFVFQRQKQLKEQELKAKLEEEKKLEDAQKAKLEEQKKLEEAQKSKELEKEAAKKDPAAANSNCNSKPSKVKFPIYSIMFLYGKYVLMQYRCILEAT